MTTPSNALALWDNGRLVPRPRSRSFPFDREQVLCAVFGIAALVVFAIFVAVLENDVRRSELAQAAQRARVVAEAECESARPAATRGGCVALFDGATPDAALAAADAAPVNTAYADGRLTMAALGGGAQ